MHLNDYKDEIYRKYSNGTHTRMQARDVTQIDAFVTARAKCIFYSGVAI